jgi:GntR family transcriptional regulator
VGDIDLDGPDPLHVQMAAVLRKRIAEGIYTRRLPSESALVAEFDLSRPTVRKALGLLKDEGLIRQVQGRGTFVTPADGDE